MVKKEEEDNPGTGYEDGQYPFVLYNRAVLPHKIMMKQLIFVFLFDLNNKLNDPINGSLVRSCVFLMTLIVGVKSYMEVSSKTSDQSYFPVCPRHNKVCGRVQNSTLFSAFRIIDDPFRVW